jgi:hypothetical protein
MLSPLVNPLLRLVSQGNEDSVTVSTRVGDDLLNYTMTSGPDDVAVEGTSNGDGFSLEIRPSDKPTLKGRMPGGEVEVSLGYRRDNGHSFLSQGTIGEVSFEQITTLHDAKDENRFATVTGEYGSSALRSEVLKTANDTLLWRGTVGGEQFFQLIKISEDSALAAGFLGGELFLQTVRATRS